MADRLKLAPMTERTPPPSRVPPRPPAQLWGIWVVDDDCPRGYWYNHTNSVQYNGIDDTPMTFVRKEDAVATAEVDQDFWGDHIKLTVAVIGVAPPTPASRSRS